MDITERMIQVGRIVDVEVVDHLIISLGGYFSVQKTGLLDKLKLSEKWVPRFQEEERIRKEALKLGEKRGIREGKKIGMEKGIEKGIKKGREEGREEEKIEMARKLKERGIDIDIIAETSGLSKVKIKKL